MGVVILTFSEDRLSLKSRLILQRMMAKVAKQMFPEGGKLIDPKVALVCFCFFWGGSP